MSRLTNIYVILEMLVQANFLTGAKLYITTSMIDAALCDILYKHLRNTLTYLLTYKKTK